jgi:hypothetical protein
MLLPLTLLTALLAPQTSDPTAPPPSAQVSLTVIGHGVQIYRCTAQAAAQPITFAWILQEPEATLYDPATGAETGKHTAGPKWTWKDESAIVGKVLQKAPSPDPNAIPWLLLEAHSTGEPGALSNVKFVRRSNTQAGQAPTSGCDAAHVDNLIRVPYQATYTFYTAP